MYLFLNRLARFFSFLLHPVIMPLVGVFIILNSDIYITVLSKDIARALYLMVIGTTIIIPLSLLPLFRYFRIIESLYMNKNRERLIPYFITFILYYGTHYLIKNFFDNQLLSAFLFSISIIVLIVIIISYFWKISMHMVGIGGITGLVLIISYKFGVDFMNLLAGVLFFSGLLGTSRIWLKSHTSMQVYVGFLLGFSLVFLQCLFFA